MARRCSWLWLALDGAGDQSGGVPSYPLYKQVASALSRGLKGASVGSCDGAGQAIREDGSVEAEKIGSWDKMIAEKGLELENVRVSFCVLHFDFLCHFCFCWLIWADQLIVLIFGWVGDVPDVEKS